MDKEIEDVISEASAQELLEFLKWVFNPKIDEEDNENESN